MADLRGVSNHEESERVRLHFSFGISPLCATQDVTSRQKEAMSFMAKEPTIWSTYVFKALIILPCLVSSAAN